MAERESRREGEGEKIKKFLAAGEFFALYDTFPLGIAGVLTGLGRWYMRET